MILPATLVLPTFRMVLGWPKPPQRTLLGGKLTVPTSGGLLEQQGLKPARDDWIWPPLIDPAGLT
jgi:hypothetical protein